MAKSKTEVDQTPIIFTASHRVNIPLRVTVVGAGGTGGRVIPPLMQMLRRNDTVCIVDGDHVEDRNLARQNFRARDVGENKAEVMARRYRRDGLTIHAYASMLTEETANDITYDPSTPDHIRIILGCVDNWRARQTMDALVGVSTGRTPTIWIDGGNERRGGQVLLNFRNLSCKVTGPSPAGTAAALQSASFTHTAAFQMRGVLALPQLLKARDWHCDRCDVDNPGERETCRKCDQPEASCQDRIDLQTVTVNQLSATCILNVLSCLLYQIPMSSCGAFFSVLNTMSPIKLASVDWSNMRIHPDTTYADRG